jgi:predicted GIY-YIG superfamily endonuclease
MRSQRLTFNYINLTRVPKGERGIYILWCGDICIYIGKAEKSTIHARLNSHYSGSHNDGLNMWIQSSHELEFQYEMVRNSRAISAKERNRIKQLSPVTNKRLINRGE